MGCDIHMFVEFKSKDGNWKHGDYYKKNQNYEKGSEYNGNEFEILELHGNRDYHLFSTLAGVRDYSGKIKPVAEPKGLPEDVTECVKSISEEWDSDGHTHSFLSLRELRSYDSKNHKITVTGLLNRQQRIDLENGILPDEWCQGTNQPDHERREWQYENETLKPLIVKLQQRAKEIFQYEWNEYDFKNDENIRIVFFFDN